MNSWTLFFVIMCGMVSFLFFYNYLMMLLSIELMMIIIYFLSSYVNSKLNFSMDLILLLISMIIIEGVFGLSLLISFSHNFGNDYVVI